MFGDRPPPPKNPILHIRGETKTLCGKKIGRVYTARPESLATCRKCIAAATPGADND